MSASPADWPFHPSRRIEDRWLLSDGRAVTSAEYAQASWCIAQLFLRRRSHARIRASDSVVTAVAEELVAYVGQGLEALPILIRSKLVATVHSLFAEWPGGMIRFFAGNNLSAEHLSQDKAVLPSWFQAEVMHRVGRQVRGISASEVQAAANCVAQSGQRPNKAAVARRLGVNAGKEIDRLFGRRAVAAEHELSSTLRMLLDACSEVPRRRSTLEMRTRDATIISLAILESKSLAAVVTMRREEVIVALAKWQGLSEPGTREHFVIELLGQCFSNYERLTAGLSKKRKTPEADYFFLGLKATPVTTRSAQRMLSTAMANLDPRLQRSPQVFSRWISRGQPFTDESLSSNGVEPA